MIFTVALTSWLLVGLDYAELKKPVVLEAVERYRFLDQDPCPTAYRQTLGMSFSALRRASSFVFVYPVYLDLGPC